MGGFRTFRSTLRRFSYYYQRADWTDLAAELFDYASSIIRWRSLKLREFGDGTAELIYYERPDKAGPKASKYTRTQVSDAASMRELLGQVLETKAVVSKRREVFLTGRTRIHLDEVDGLGTFMELEVVLTEDETDSDGERIASALMEQLGVRQEDLVEQAYVDLSETIDRQ
jgi:predicted adenylyl cyclase CyaB